MSMPDTEFYGLTISLLGGGVLTPPEQEGYTRAARDRHIRRQAEAAEPRPTLEELPPLTVAAYHRIRAVEGFEAAAGEPSPDWLPFGAAYVVATEAFKAGMVTYFQDAAALSWLLVEADDDGTPTFTVHPTMQLVGEHLDRQGRCDFDCEPCRYEATRPLQLIDLSSGTSMRPQASMTYEWVESQCVLTGDPAEDPADHATHAHQEVTRR